MLATMVVLSSVLVLRDAATVGVDEARDALVRIDAGEPALVVGGPFMSNRKVRLGAETVTLDEAKRRLANIEMSHEALGPKAGWRDGKWTVSPSPRMPKGGRIEPTAEGGRRFVTGGPLVQWETHYLNVSPYAADDDLLVLEVRSAYPNAQVSLELEDKAKVRWFATLDVGTNWQKVALSAADFVGHGISAARRMKPSEIWRLGFGVSEQYTPRMIRRPSSFEVRRFGSVRNPFPADVLGLPADFPKTTVEGLWPSYKTWEKNGKLAFFDRNDGAGYGRGNIWRQKYLGNEHEMILLERRKGRPERCVALFGYLTHEQLQAPGVRERMEKTLSLLKGNGAILFEGGSDQFAYFPGETAKIGASWRGNAKKVRFEIGERGGRSLVKREFSGSELKGGRVEFSWPVPTAGAVWRVTVTLDDGADAISHEFALARQGTAPRADFITARDGDFWLKGRKWYSVCINFWPLYSAATERNDYWGTWQKDGYYSPNLVRKDLESFRRLGGNTISIQYGGSGCGRNVRDLYRICRELGIYVNQSLASATPFDRSPKQQAELEAYFADTGAADDATVFAYDTVWEPGNYVFREGWSGQGAGFSRDRWNRDWQDWTVEQFGSVERAVKVWGTDPGRDAKGLLKSPPQVAFVGRDDVSRWRKIMASYRRFMDNLTSRKWAVLRRELAALAPRQLQSFRQGNTLPHDFALTGPMRHIDFVMPEGYSFADSDEDEVAIGWITRYVDAYSNRKPILWSEFGRNAWDRKCQFTDPKTLEACAGYTERFYRAGLAAGANGFSPWWFPGGYRADEKSDYGYMGPDGTPRAPLRKFAEWVPAMVRERAKPADVPTRVFDRDANPGGYYAAAFVERLPAEAMKIAGAELTSADAPAVALGDLPLEGEMPLKYLDADFDFFAVTPTGNGKLTVRAQLGNPGPATWKTGASGSGGVSLVAFDAVSGKTLAAMPLSRDVPRLGTTEELALEVPVAGATKVAFRLEAKNRFRFGEKKVWTRPSGERVMLIGDSITEIALMNRATGFYHQLTNAAASVSPDLHLEFLPLGYSGYRLDTWMQMERQAMTAAFPVRDAFPGNCKTKPIPLKTVLDGGADTIVIFLGMNDLLKPRVSADPASHRAWLADYGKFVDNLEARCRPRRFVFASITPLTADEESPKNVVRRELNALLRQYAAERGAAFADYGEVVRRLNDTARGHSSGLRIVSDFVHPNGLGHTVMAQELCRAAGWTKMESHFKAKGAAELRQLGAQFKSPSFGLRLLPDRQANVADADELVYRIPWHFNGAMAKGESPQVTLPEGWRLVRNARTGDCDGEIVVRGAPHALRNLVKVSYGAASESVSIATPWRVSDPFEPKAGERLPTEIPHWQLSTPTWDYTGSANGVLDPGSIDQYQVFFGSPTCAFYARRWVKAPADMELVGELTHQSFSDTLTLKVSVGGVEQFTETLDRRGKNRATGKVRLRRGWNELTVRNDHQDWQNQFAFNLKTPDGKEPAGLVYDWKPDR